MKNSDKSLARYLSVQAIYQRITSESNFEDVIKQFVDDNFKEVPISLDGEVILKKKIDLQYFKNIVLTFNKNEKLVFELINQNLSDNWSYQRLPNVLKAILISSVSEIISNPKISIGIITSEYIKLTESFFLDKESSFVNAFVSKVHSLKRNIENVE